MIILNGILWHKLQLLPISRVLISVWNDLWSYWTIVSCYEMGVEKWKWYEMSILLILNVCVTKWVNFAIWLILDQSEQNSLTLLIFVMKWVTHIGQYEWFYLYVFVCMYLEYLASTWELLGSLTLIGQGICISQALLMHFQG